jgi:spermidine/putrescine transport system permease protein
VFALSIDDFVISQFLSSGASSITIPVRLYAGARLAPPPSLNALATVLMLITILSVVLAGLAYRVWKKRSGGDESTIESLASFEV